MRWSYPIAQVMGISIKVHITFLIIVTFFAARWGVVHGVAGVLFGTVLILLLFACVTLHELGHSLVAQRVGIPVREIILLPLGGLAVMSRNPTRPLHELLIAIAGPLVNVAIALLLLLLLSLSGGLTMLDLGSMVQGADTAPSLRILLIWLLQANVLLVLFNMIPAFPLDGGRVLRAILAMFMGFRRATRLASSIGQSFAIFLGVIGLFSFDVFLILIAVFIFFGAGQEQAEAQASTVLSTRRVGDAYNKYVLTLAAGDRVSKVLDYVLTSYQPDFAVVQGARLLGVITRDDVLRGLSSAALDTNVPDSYVTAMMRRDVLRVDANASLDQVRHAMSEQGERLAAVYEGESYLGLISLEDIGEALTVLTFTERYQQQPPDA